MYLYTKVSIFFLKKRCLDPHVHLPITAISLQQPVSLSSWLLWRGLTLTVILIIFVVTLKSNIVCKNIKGTPMYNMWQPVNIDTNKNLEDHGMHQASPAFQADLCLSQEI